MIEQQFSKQQLEQLELSRQKIGPEAMAQAQKDWLDLIADFESEIEKGTEPSDPVIKLLAARWTKLFNTFTANDPAIRQLVEKMYDADPVAASHGTVSREVYEYIKRADTHWSGR